MISAPAAGCSSALRQCRTAGDPAGVVARFAGYGRIVLLSAQGVVTHSDSLSHGTAFAAFEQAVMASGTDWTIPRPGGFASNAYAWAESVRTARTVAAPFGEVGLPVVDPDDIAAVAASVLIRPGHEEARYEPTGPTPTAARERAAAIAAVLGAPVSFVEQSREEVREQMLAFMPAPVADTTLGTPTPAKGPRAPTSRRSPAAPRHLRRLGPARRRGLPLTPGRGPVEERRDGCGELDYEPRAASSLSVKSAMLAVAGPHEELIIDRDAHESVVSGLTLAGTRPRWGRGTSARWAPARRRVTTRAGAGLVVSSAMSRRFAGTSPVRNRRGPGQEMDNGGFRRVRSEF
ncbi:hypothetical protein EDD29_5215 [Actinocorallia herbida]|uniref:NmrA-like family protein n=1 Tax=Actinocorallia herbida TaxID=58109 RepID=A0A3N1D236_9ACTN|nr:hypothetical protein [Actinocorallia herbida]ROO87599.1 hypothetical protein EDD29_5215 [Actinocorallia herbida]